MHTTFNTVEEAGVWLTTFDEDYEDQRRETSSGIKENLRRLPATKKTNHQVGKYLPKPHSHI